MLVALSTSLYFLARPVAPAHADTTTTTTDVFLTPVLACAQDGVTPSGQVEIQFSGLSSTGTPIGSTQKPVGVQVGLVSTGQQTFSASPAGNPPTYVALMGSAANVWLAGTFTAGESVLVLEDGTTTPQVYTLPVDASGQPNTCTANPTSLAPSDFGLVSPPSLPTIASFTTTCNVDGSASLGLTLATPYTPLPANYSAASLLTEIDEGVFVADQAGGLLASGGSTLVRFVATDPTYPTETLPAITIPAGSTSTYQAYVTGPDGQVSQPLPIPACTPQTTATTDTTAVVAPSTDASTSVASSSSAPTSDSRTSESSTSLVTSASPSTTPTPPPTSANETPVQSVPPQIIQPTTPVDSGSAISVSPSLSVTPVSIPAPVIDPATSDPFAGSGGIASYESSSTAPSHDVSASPTVTISGPAAQISVHDTDVASSPSTIKPVQILRWHRDAALVVGFDALAICSLVGATVWSARRR